MANEQEESVSALADGELDPRQLDALLARMREDETLRSRWARYHLISDALHNNLTRGTQLDISQRVSAAIENEPVIFAPLWQRMRPARRTVKQVASVAMAASVTAVAILGAQWANLGMMSGPVTVATATSTVTASSSPATKVVVAEAQDPSASGQPVSEQPGDGEQTSDEAWVRNLDSYVANHNEYSGNTGMRGVLPYARLVSYESQ